MADEVELPVQGLDLVIHLGNEVICRRTLHVVTTLFLHASRPLKCSGRVIHDLLVPAEAYLGLSIPFWLFT